LGLGFFVGLDVLEVEVHLGAAVRVEVRVEVGVGVELTLVVQSDLVQVQAHVESLLFAHIQIQTGDAFLVFHHDWVFYVTFTASVGLLHIIIHRVH